MDKRKTEKKKYRFSYSPERKWLRYGLLGLFALCMTAGFGAFAALIAPYSSYGRIASNLFAPICRWGNNLLACFAERAGSYAFYETEVWLKGLSAFMVAAATFIVLAVLAWRNGRTYCNTICPVGTVLGFLSRFRCSASRSTGSGATGADSVRAHARRPASTVGSIGWITAAAWRAWTASKPAGAAPSVFGSEREVPGAWRRGIPCGRLQTGRQMPHAAVF